MDGKGIIEQSSDTCIFYSPSLVLLCLTNWLDLSSLTVFRSLLGATIIPLWLIRPPPLEATVTPPCLVHSPPMGDSVTVPWMVCSP